LYRTINAYFQYLDSTAAARGNITGRTLLRRKHSIGLAQQAQLIATKFFVGGASFNKLRATDDDSRRIEFKLEFKSRQDRVEEKANPPATVNEDKLMKALDPRQSCPLQDR
jgi:hypothetical protein